MKENQFETIEQSGGEVVYGHDSELITEKYKKLTKRNIKYSSTWFFFGVVTWLGVSLTENGRLTTAAGGELVIIVFNLAMFAFLVGIPVMLVCGQLVAKYKKISNMTVRFFILILCFIF